MHAQNKSWNIGKEEKEKRKDGMMEKKGMMERWKYSITKFATFI
jgi:hypothetical protein